MNLEKLRQAEAAFLQRFPGGFENPEIIATRVRKHKPDQMIALAQESFSRGNFRLPELIVRNMIKLITRSSIISVFEKPQFRDFANALAPQEKEFLSDGMEQLLHGDEQTGFEMILDLLQNGKSAKWSLMTVCQTYYHPQRDVFVKPTTVKGVIDYFELESLQYKPTPSWAFYEAYRSVFHEMKSKVDASLSPTNAAFSGFLWMTIRGEVF
ncbi:MAG TPA: hypothetical protein VFY66_10505 [Anaerolineales bacterium]|nr:hypothetical protein [Anaerolineales bacterium]